MPKAAADLTSPRPLHNLPLAEIVDQLGLVRVAAAEIEAREKALKAELAARDVRAADGALYRLTVTVAARWTLDAERVKAEMGVGWYDSRCKVGSVTTFRVAPRPDALRAAHTSASASQAAA